MSTTGKAALLLGALALMLLFVWAVTWRVLLALVQAVERLPILAETRTWVRLSPLRTWLRIRHPRAFAIFIARLDPAHFRGLPLTLLTVAATYVASLLGGLAEDVIEPGPVLGFDQAVSSAFDPLRIPALVAIFKWITAFGAGPTLTAVALTATGFLWAHRRGDFVVPLWVTFLGAQATTWAGKYLIDRRRPEFIPGVTEASPSFPSGHATASMALYCFIAYVIARDLRGHRRRFEVVFWTTALVGLIGFSRVFLSVHFMTDVVAGFLVGGFWLLVGIAIREWTYQPH